MGATAADVWPLYGLRLTTPCLELGLPDLPSLASLAAVAARGVHDPARMPFTVPWTDGTPEDRARRTFQHVLSTVATLSPGHWTLSLAVRSEGEVVGRQDLMGRDFAVTGEASTGSWLGRVHHGRGIGTQMRAAVLHLAFEGLGAHSVTSSAMADNPASLGVSRRLGYRPDGLTVAAVRGRPCTLRRLRLDRASWERHRTVPVEIRGLAECRELFGADGPAPGGGAAGRREEGSRRPPGPTAAPASAPGRAARRPGYAGRPGCG